MAKRIIAVAGATGISNYLANLSWQLRKSRRSGLEGTREPSPIWSPLSLSIFVSNYLRFVHWLAIQANQGQRPSSNTGPTSLSKNATSTTNRPSPPQWKARTDSSPWQIISHTICRVPLMLPRKRRAKVWLKLPKKPESNISSGVPCRKSKNGLVGSIRMYIISMASGVLSNTQRHLDLRLNLMLPLPVICKTLLEEDRVAWSASDARGLMGRIKMEL